MRKGVAMMALASASAETFYASPNEAGSVEACVASLRHPGDQCLFKKGRYRPSDLTHGMVAVSGLAGTKDKPFVIGSATGKRGDVVFDGTLPVGDACDGSWQPYESQATRLGQRRGATGQAYVCDLDRSVVVNQLFVDGAIQMAARWPNARVDDRSAFMGPERWAHSKVGGTHDPVKTGKGELLDAGACAAASDCCSRCNENDLAASGVDATGAVAVLNLWENGVGVEKIKKHAPGSGTLEYEATWCKDEIQQRGKCEDGYTGGAGRYYLEASLNLLDTNGEWYFDAAAHKLYLWTDAGGAPTAGSVAYKAMPYAFTFEDSSYVHLGNITFFATAIKAYADNAAKHNIPTVTDMVFDTLDFTHPDSSARMTGDLLSQDTVTVWTDNTHSMKYWTNHRFTGCTFTLAENKALHAQGNGNVYENCAFEWNSWTSLCSSVPPPAVLDGNCGTFSPGGAAPQDGTTALRRLTFRFNGPSKCMRPGGQRNITLVHFEGQLALADDGTFVESGGEESSYLTYNWAHNSGKGALRYDGDDAHGTANGIMAFNVVWNVSAFKVKGDNHTFANNVGFDASDMPGSFAKHTFPHEGQTQGDDLDVIDGPPVLNLECPGATTPTANEKSRFTNNVLTNVGQWKTFDAASNCPFPGAWKGNLVRTSTPYRYDEPDALTYFTINSELRWPWGRDFRPCAGSQATAMRAGAYPAYTPHDKVYWIPGALREQASEPSPQDGEGAAIVDADLLFLGALRAVGHDVFFGEAGGGLKKIASLTGDENVVQIPAGLKKHIAYAWRVDGKLNDGSVVAGAVWSFTTGGAASCPAAPPAPPAPKPISAKCLQELDDCCQDRKGATKQCYNMVSRHLSKATDCTDADAVQYCRLPPTEADGAY